MVVLVLVAGTAGTTDAAAPAGTLRRHKDTLLIDKLKYKYYFMHKVML